MDGCVHRVFPKIVMQPRTRTCITYKQCISTAGGCVTYCCVHKAVIKIIVMHMSLLFIAPGWLTTQCNVTEYKRAARQEASAL